MAGETILAANDRITVANPSVSTSEFTIDFELFDDDDLAVYIDGVVETGFTVAATYVDGVADNAVITLDVAVSGVTVTIVGSFVPRRDEEFVAGGEDLVKTFNADMARAIAIAQEAYQRDQNSIRFPSYEFGYTSVLPAASARASKYLAFDSSGNVTATGTAPSTQWQGAFTTALEPTTRLDLSPLEDGDLYFNTTINRLKVYETGGGTWVTGVDTSTAIDINGMTAIASLAIGDFVPAYDISVAGNRKVTVQKFWDSVATLTQLSAAAATADQVPIYDADASSAVYITVTNLLNAVTNLTALTAPALADTLLIYDDAVGVKKITPDNLFKSVNLLTTEASPDSTNDYLLLYDASTGLAKKATPAAVAGLGGIIHVRDEKAAGTNGGTFTSGAWQTRTLNTSVTNTISGASLATNQITLPAGTYEIEARAPGLDCGNHKAKLRNITDGTDVIVGASTRSGDSNTQMEGTVVGRFTIAASKVFELQHRCSVTKATTGFGQASNFSVTEVYAEVIVRKVG